MPGNHFGNCQDKNKYRPEVYILKIGAVNKFHKNIHYRYISKDMVIIYSVHPFLWTKYIITRHSLKKPSILSGNIYLRGEHR